METVQRVFTGTMCTTVTKLSLHVMTPCQNNPFKCRRKTYFGSMLYASLFRGLLLCCFVCPAHGTKGSNNAQASVHALYMVHTIPLLLSFAVCSAERGCCQPAEARLSCQLVL